MTVYNCLWHLVENDQETLVKLSEEILIEMIKEVRSMVTNQAHANGQQLTMSYNDLLNNSVNECQTKHYGKTICCVIWYF